VIKECTSAPPSSLNRAPKPNRASPEVKSNILAKACANRMDQEKPKNINEYKIWLQKQAREPKLIMIQ
jgi:hypothetical protein